MHVPHQDRLTVSRLRREQRHVDLGSGWGAIAKFADPAIEGLISQCRAAGVQPPDECGVDIDNEAGEVVANLELAWWKQKIGVVIHDKDAEAARRRGWRVDKVNYTIEHVHELKAALSER